MKHAIKDAIKDNDTYSMWHDMQEQWDPEDIDEPVMQCQARNAIEAAERCADDTDDNNVNLIVRNDRTGEYRNIELQRSWNVKTDRPTSLKELSEP